MLDDFGVSYELNFSYKRGLAYQLDTLKKISENFGVVGSQVPEIGIGDGETFDGIGESGDIKVGIGGSEYQFLSYYKKMPDRMFVASLVSVYHEGRHAELFREFQNIDVQSELVYSHMVSKENRQYYLKDGNRFKYCTEIDAEYFGVMGAYEDLNRFVTLKGLHISADDLICDFVNYQSESMSYYIHHPEGKPFTSVEEIDDAFQIAYEKATSREPVKRDRYGRAEESGNYRSFKISWKGDCAIDFLTLPNGKIRPDREYMLQQIWDASNYDKDRMIAAIVLHEHPEYGKFYYGLNVEELSLNNVFGRQNGIERDLDNTESFENENISVDL